MNLAWRINPAWWELIRSGVRTTQAYRFEYLTMFISMAIRLFLIRALWTAIYDGRASVAGISAEQQIVYITIVSIQANYLLQSIDWTMQDRVESGSVALDLLRPCGFLQQMMAQQVGRTLGNAPYLIVLIPIGLVIGSLRMPNAWNLLPYLASLVLAYIVSMLTWMLVGMLVFWIMQVNAVRVMLHIASALLAGALVPMWFMPDWMRIALQFLPFQAVEFLPASIFVGYTTGADLIQPFAVQLAWIVILWFANVVVWKRAQRRIVIQGG